MAEDGSGTTYDVVVKRTFDAPPDRVWRAWTDPADVRQWWGPIGFTCPVAEMDVRVGGRSLVAMRAPQEFGGQDMYSTWTYTTLVPNERIEYTFNFSDEQGNRRTPAEAGVSSDVPADGHHVVTLEDLGDGRTDMTVTEHAYASVDSRDMSRMGLEQCVDKMAAVINR